jgi:hypothetical protein
MWLIWDSATADGRYPPSKLPCIRVLCLILSRRAEGRFVPIPLNQMVLSNKSSAWLLTWRMPSKATVFGFFLAIAIATSGAWFLAGFSLKEVMGLFLSMLLGGSIYFLVRVRD